MKIAEAHELKQLIDSKNRFLLNCHAFPDADSVGSAIALREVLKAMGKEVQIICSHSIPKNFGFLLKKYGEIKTVDYSQFDFSSFDLFIITDTSSMDRLTGDNIDLNINIPLVVVDHHKSNPGFGQLNLIKQDISATCELLYWIFKEWGVDIQSASTPLLTGIIGDTGAFRFPEANIETMTAAQDLMQFADKNEIIFNLYQSYPASSLKFWGKVLESIQIDESGFAWVAIPLSTFRQYNSPVGSKSEIADIFFQSIEDTSFGLVIVQEQERITGVSLRSRTGMDVSSIAQNLGGGGHNWAAAARIKDKSFEEALAYILNISREYAKNNKS